MKLFILILWTPSLLFAVPHEISFEEKVFHSLRKPHQQAVDSVTELGSPSYEKLQEISFNDKFPMNTRWKSFMVMTQVAGMKSVPDIKKALLSTTWFMRSAGLTALSQLDGPSARKWALQKLDKDPSLMVRMKAFEILSAKSDEQVIELFWQKLYSKDSFHKNKSLWIREDLAHRLLERPRQRDASRWIQVLHDSDPKLQVIASQALADLNKETSVGGKDVSYWQQKYPQNKNL